MRERAGSPCATGASEPQHVGVKIWHAIGLAVLTFLLGALLTAERDRQVLGERLARLETKMDHVVLTIGPPAPPRRGDE